MSDRPDVPDGEVDPEWQFPYRIHAEEVRGRVKELRALLLQEEKALQKAEEEEGIEVLIDMFKDASGQLYFTEEYMHPDYADVRYALSTFHSVSEVKANLPYDSVRGYQKSVVLGAPTMRELCDKALIYLWGLREGLRLSEPPKPTPA